MHIELSKKELKELKKLRAQIHRSSAVSTIKEMFERSEAFGDRVAVVEKIKKQDVVYTVKDFHDRVRQVGTALYELGLGGKHISIVSENSYNWIVVFFAIDINVFIVYLIVFFLSMHMNLRSLFFLFKISFHCFLVWCPE